MTAKELIDLIVKYNFYQEDVDEVYKFARIVGDIDGKPLACCGMCKYRNTDACPWKNQSTLIAPPCLSYEKK